MIEEKKIRSDKAKNISKVLKEVINNPLQSQRDIAQNTWLSLWAVNSSLKEVEQIWTDKQIVDLVKLDIELQELATAEMVRRIKNDTEKVNNQDIVRFNETAFKRSQLLWLKDNKKEIVVTFEI